MRTYLDCYPCFLRQALTAARLTGADADAQQEVVRSTLALLADLPAGAEPPRVAELVHGHVRTELGGADAYRAVREEATRRALDVYLWLMSLVEAADDPLEAALRISIAGNALDVAPGGAFPDLREAVLRVMDASFAVDDVAVLRAELARTPWLLMVGDNAGETVFDRVLIETLRIPVTYVVKGGPTLNDATREDARAAGLESCARIVDTGVAAPGLSLDRCSAALRRTFLDAPLVLAKGQANYESLSDAGERVFSVLQVTCGVIATDVGAPVGSLVVRRGTRALATV